MGALTGLKKWAISKKGMYETPADLITPKTKQNKTASVIGLGGRGVYAKGPTPMT